MAARKDDGEVGGSTGIKRKEKVELGEDHDWLVEAERVEPGLTAEITAVKRKKVKNRKWKLWYMFLFCLRLIFNLICVMKMLMLLDAFDVCRVVCFGFGSLKLRL
jgi:hypothetical protein